MDDLAALDQETEALAVRLVSQIRRILPPGWIVADWQVFSHDHLTEADPSYGLRTLVVSCQRDAQSLEVATEWWAGAEPSSLPDAEVRAAFDRHLAEGRGDAA